MNKTLLLSEAELKNNSLIEQNVDSKILSKIIFNVQETQLNDVLGETLYNQIINEVSNNIINSTPITETTSALINSYIIPFLTYAVICDFIVINNYKLSNKGTLKLNDNSGSSINTQEVEFSKNYYDNYKAQYKKKLIEFLQSNNLSTIGTDKNITSESIGWFLESRSNCYGIKSSSTIQSTIVIEVEIGTPEATALGLINGLQVYTNPAFIGRKIEIFRNGTLVPLIYDPYGDPYASFDINTGSIDFMDSPIINTEIIKIKTF